jgi:hypothetical protein
LRNNERMNIQKLIGTAALLVATYSAYELVSTSRVTSVIGTMTKIDFPVKSASAGNFQFNFSTDIPKVEIAFAHNGQKESFVTAYSPRGNHGTFYTAKIGLEVPLVFFNNKPRTVTLAHYHSHSRFRLFILLPLLLLVAGLGFTGRLKRMSDRF